MHSCQNQHSYLQNTTCETGQKNASHSRGSLENRGWVTRKPRDGHFTLTICLAKFARHFELYWWYLVPEAYRNTRLAVYYRVTRKMLRARHFSRDLPRVTLTRHCPFSCVMYCTFDHYHKQSLVWCITHWCISKFWLINGEENKRCLQFFMN